VPRRENAAPFHPRDAKSAFERKRSGRLANEAGDRESDEGQDSTRSDEAFELEHGAFGAGARVGPTHVLERSRLFSREIMPPPIGSDPRVTIRRSLEASIAAQAEGLTHQR
jgi:hypothetical protein